MIGISCLYAGAEIVLILRRTVGGGDQHRVVTVGYRVKALQHIFKGCKGCFFQLIRIEIDLINIGSVYLGSVIVNIDQMRIRNGKHVSVFRIYKDQFAGMNIVFCFCNRNSSDRTVFFDFSEYTVGIVGENQK